MTLRDDEGWEDNWWPSGMQSPQMPQPIQHSISGPVDIRTAGPLAHRSGFGACGSFQPMDAGLDQLGPEGGADRPRMRAPFVRA